MILSPDLDQVVKSECWSLEFVSVWGSVQGATLPLANEPWTSDSTGGKLEKAVQCSCGNFPTLMWRVHVVQCN